MTTPYSLPRIVSRIRKSIEARPNAHRYLHRLSAIARGHGLTFTINLTTAGAFLDGDLVACAMIESRVDKVADWFGCDVSAVSVDGTLLYRRIQAS